MEALLLYWACEHITKKSLRIHTWKVVALSVKLIAVERRRIVMYDGGWDALQFGGGCIEKRRHCAPEAVGWIRGRRRGPWWLGTDRE